VLTAELSIAGSDGLPASRLAPEPRTARLAPRASPQGENRVLVSASAMANRRGFGVRLDKPGVRVSGGKATDIETYVTEYLRDKLADAEETLASGGGDARLLQQRLSAMEAEVSSAIRLGAEVDMLRSQLRDKDEQISILRPGAGDATQELRARLQQQQERVRSLEQENAIITRERELGVSTVGGSVSQERYDQLVNENKRLALQIERGETDGGGGLSTADLMDLQAVKRDVKKMKQEKQELQHKYEQEVARRRELEDQGPMGGFASENPGTMRELRDKIANLVIQNKQLSAAAEGSHQVMFDAQQKVEEKVIEMEELRRDKDSEIAALEKNIQQAQQVRPTGIRPSHARRGHAYCFFATLVLAASQRHNL
jgi:chromosome segregation ATPase